MGSDSKTHGRSSRTPSLALYVSQVSRHVFKVLVASVMAVGVLIPLGTSAQDIRPAKQDAAERDAAKRDVGEQDAAKQDAAKQDGADTPGGRPTPVPLDGATKLPWNMVDASRSRLPVRRLGGPRELLDLYGVDDSHIRQLFDGRPVDGDEEESLVRILYRLPRFGLESIDRWTQPPVAGAEMAAAPDDFRIQFFRIEGRVLRVERHVMLPELAKLFDFDSYYLVQFQRTDDPHPVLICAREVPSAWPLDEPLDERARVAGLFLKVGDESLEPSPLVFAAHRVAWLPDAPRPEWGITRHHVLLAELGMDISLLDDVRDRNRKPIGKSDRECFYQMLAAVGRLSPELLARYPADTIDLAPLLLDPKSQHGRLIRCRGTARRITRIEVNDPDIQERFGIDHYFQLDVSLPLGDQTVRLGKSDEDGPVFTNTFPATFCVLRLPAKLQKLADKMTAGQLESETLNEQVVVSGFYFKLWAFRSQYISSFDEQQRQIAPMLIAAEPQVVEYSYARDPWVGLLLGCIFLGLLLVAWFGVWRFNRGATRFERTVVNRQFESEPGKSLNESGIEAQDGPDFSNLN